MEALIWGITTVVGTTVLAAISKRVVDWSFERSATLAVQVTINESVSSPAIWKHFVELRRAALVGSDGSPKWEDFDKYYAYFHAEAYARIKVKNNSKKKVPGLTFCAHEVSSGLLQTGDGEVVQLTSNVPVALGDLQPKREIVLHVLASTLWKSGSPRGIKEGFVFSADELGRVDYKFPMPTYLEMKRRGQLNFFLNALYFSIMAAAVALVVFGIVKQMGGP